MSSVDRRRLEELFQQAVDLPVAERAGFVERACGGEAALRAELEALLAEDASGTKGVLATPASHLMEASDDADEPVPERLGPFRIVRVLGEGGMGRVYEAEQDSPRRTVALKVIQPGVMSRSALRRFELEAQVLAGLKHPGIAQIHQTGSVPQGSDADAPPRPYFAMEMVRGPGLMEFARTRQLGMREKLAVLAKIADAVQHAHQRGVIHRDLKPANILVEDAPEGVRDETATASGVSAQPKILDFGIARLIDREQGSASMRTEAGALVGTLAYMSPEQVEADPTKIDTRSDVYALGVIGYELLAGRPPIDVAGKPIYEAVRLVRETEAAALGRVDATLRGDVETIVAKAMDKNPARRYSSAAELAADIRRYLGDQPIAARPASTWYQARKFARRNRALVGAGALAATALVAGAALLAVGLVRATRAEALAVARATAEAEQRAAAERRFQEVRALAKTVIFEIHEKVMNLTGSTEAQKLIIDTGMKYLDNLAKDAADDEALRGELATGYLRLANLLGDPASANLGDIAGAMQTVRKAIALLEPDLARKPDDGLLANRLSSAFSALGDLERVSGRIPDSIVSYTRGLELARIAAAAFPDDRKRVDDLVASEASLGRLKDQAGDREGAIRHYAVARDHFRLRSAEDPTSPRYPHNVGVLALKIAEAKLAMGRHGEGELELRTALDDVLELRQRFPGYGGVRTTEVSLLFALGNALLEQKCANEALTTLQRAYEAQHRLRDADRLDQRAARNLGVACFWLAQAYSELGDETMSLWANLRFCELAEEVSSANPTYIVARHDLALGYGYVADSWRRMGRFDEAIRGLEQSAIVLNELHEAAPEDVAYASAQIECLCNLGQLRLLMGLRLPREADERAGLLNQAEGALVMARGLWTYLDDRGRLPAAYQKHVKRVDQSLAELRAAR